jgi:SagB-type dehydrogenase family enzyme
VNKTLATIASLLIMLMMGLACGPGTAPAADGPARASAQELAADGPAAASSVEPLEVIDLPPPRHDGPMSLEKTLKQRQSVRSFTDEPLTMEELSQLLWAAQGITREPDRRTAPSAGAKYPIELYVVTREQLLHYVPEGHRLEVLRREDLRPTVGRASTQDFVTTCPALFVITAVHERVQAKYKHRFVRYVRLESGHVAQNIILQAVSLGLGAVPVGGFKDRVVTKALGLPEDHAPEYLIPIGNPGPRRR